MSEALPRPGKKLSKSRAPKNKREPHQPKEELLPDVEDYFRSAAYIDQRAAMGEFKGAPAAVLPILHYLWRHAWREQHNPEKAERGTVMAGKSKLAKIAADLNISYNSAQRAITDLVNANWLAWYGYRDDQTMILQVRMDMDGHRDRQSSDETGVPSQVTPPSSESTVEGDRDLTGDTPCPERSHPPPHRSHPPTWEVTQYR